MISSNSVDGDRELAGGVECERYDDIMSSVCR